jgi:hypothetical protein
VSEASRYSTASYIKSKASFLASDLGLTVFLVAIAHSRPSFLAMDMSASLTPSPEQVAVAEAAQILSVPTASFKIGLADSESYISFGPILAGVFINLVGSLDSYCPSLYLRLPRSCTASPSRKHSITTRRQAKIHYGSKYMLLCFSGSTRSSRSLTSFTRILV